MEEQNKLVGEKNALINTVGLATSSTTLPRHPPRCHVIHLAVDPRFLSLCASLRRGEHYIL
jgi:hypothetical protein